MYSHCKILKSSDLTMEEVIIFFSFFKSKHLLNIKKNLYRIIFFINSDKYFYAAKNNVTAKRSYFCPWLLESDLGSVMPDKTLLFFTSFNTK